MISLGTQGASNPTNLTVKDLPIHKWSWRIYGAVDSLVGCIW